MKAALIALALAALLISPELYAKAAPKVAPQPAPQAAPQAPPAPAPQVYPGNNCEVVPPPEQLGPQVIAYLGEGVRVIKLDAEQVANITKAYNATEPKTNEKFGTVLLFLSKDGSKAVVLVFNPNDTPCHVGPIDPAKFLYDMNGGEDL